MRIDSPSLFWLGSVLALTGSLSVASAVGNLFVDVGDDEAVMVVIMLAGFAALFGAFMMALGMTPKD